METLSALLAVCEGNTGSQMASYMQSSGVFFIVDLRNCWINSQLWRRDSFMRQTIKKTPRLLFTGLLNVKILKNQINNRFVTTSLTTGGTRTSAGSMATQFASHVYIYTTEIQD